MSEVKTDKVSSITTNGDLTLDPNGTGKVVAASEIDLNGNELILDADADTSITADTDDRIDFRTGGSDRMTIDDSGNVLVGCTSTTGVGNGTNEGVFLSSSQKQIVVGVDADTAMILNRQSSNGDVLEFRKDGTTNGKIGVDSGYPYFVGPARGLNFGHPGSDAQIVPVTASAQGADDSVDLGSAGLRFDDVYATNGTIQTSDQNEKQQIASLTTAEMTAAKAISKLFKTFKWNSSVTENGDAARRHAGVIAQEVQTAMTDAGLNAAEYGFWCSNTWTNDDGNEQTRLGIRYPELLAFIGAATEQRLADIETRVAALEAN